MILLSLLSGVAFAAIAALVIDSTRDSREIRRLRSALEWERGLKVKAQQDADRAAMRAHELTHRNAQLVNDNVRLSRVSDELSRALNGNLHGEAR